MEIRQRYQGKCGIINSGMAWGTLRIYFAPDKDEKMKFKNALIYYKDLRLSNIRTAKYRHLLLLLYWPVYGFFFLTVERIWPHVRQMITGEPLIYRDVFCAWDQLIPFCEWFLIPYWFWFVFLAGMIVYGLLFDIRAFRQFSWFIMISYTVTIVIYFLWPNQQSLRPAVFPRDNFLTDCIRGLYAFDTNTNVCPSIHVLGSFAVCFAGLHSKRLKGWGWKLFLVLTTVLITLSTVFLKQHSVIDIFAALGVCALCYPLVFRWICKPSESDAMIPEA